MFIVALFTIARTWKQPRCPSTKEWIKKLWQIYIIEYYSAIKRNVFESVLVRWLNLEPVIQTEVSQKETIKYCILTHIHGTFPDSSVGKESTCNAGNPGLIPGSGRSPGEGNSYPLQYSGLENSMDYIVHGVAKSWTRLSNFHIHIIPIHSHGIQKNGTDESTSRAGYIDADVEKRLVNTEGEGEGETN